MTTTTDDLDWELVMEEDADGYFVFPSDPPAAPDPVRVLCVARRGVLLEELSRSEAAPPLAGLTASDAPRIRELVREHAPALIIVDARDVAPIPTGELMWALGAAAATMLRVVWGADTTVGQGLVAQLRARRIGHTPVDSTSGVGALVDLVAAQR